MNISLRSISSVLLSSAIAALALILGGAAVGAAESPTPYRDLKVYTTSITAKASTTGGVAPVRATMRLLNTGPVPLTIGVKLAPSSVVGFEGGQFHGVIPPHNEASWEFVLSPTPELRREVLQGHITIGGQIDRDLFVGVERGDGNSVQVVATYAPRTWECVLRACRTAEQRRLPGRIVIAASGHSDDVIGVSELALPGISAAGNLEALRRAKPSPSPEQRDLLDAVETLRRCIEAQSGARLPVRPAAAPQPRMIWLSVRSHDAAGKPIPPNDGYRLTTTSDGSVTIEALGADGLANGIYGLLTDYLDCRWFMPGELGEEVPVPADRTVRLPLIDEASGSPWTSVSGIFGGELNWARRNRAFINRGRLAIGHAWGSYLAPTPDLYAKHPEFWARDRKGHILYYDTPTSSSVTNLCSTNPEVIERVAKAVNAVFDADPNLAVGSLEPNDWSPMCTCADCLALDHRLGQIGEDGKRVADRMLYFSQQIYERLEPQNKGKLLGTLIYSWQMEPPVTMHPHAHHIGVICDMTWVYDHTRPFNDPTSPENRTFYRQMLGWRKALPGEMGFYDYYGHWAIFGPYPIIHKMREDIPAFRDLGGTFLELEISPNFGMQGLNEYIAAKLAWDPGLDVDVLLEDYYQRFYGPAADAMRGFWETAERTMALLPPGANAHKRFMASPRIWDELERQLRLAENAVAGAGVPKRFRDRIALHRMAFDYGVFRYEIEHDHNLVYADPTMGAGRDRSDTVDPDGAIRLLKARKPWLESLKARCKTDDAYWPPAVSPYFIMDVDRLVADIEAGKKGKRPRPVTQGDTDPPW